MADQPGSTIPGAQAHNNGDRDESPHYETESINHAGSSSSSSPSRASSEKKGKKLDGSATTPPATATGPAAAPRRSRSHSTRNDREVELALSRSQTRTQTSLYAVDDDELRERLAASEAAGGEYDAEKAVTEKDRSGEAAFMVEFDGPNDPWNPRSMSKSRKYMITIILALGSVCVTATSSEYTTTYGQIMPKFKIGREVATLGLSLFILGMGIGPLFLGPLSEFFGRYVVYVTSWFFFVVWLIPCAVARNFATVAVTRFLDGVSGSAFLSVAGGTVRDMFDGNELGFPMIIFTASPFVGPELGPLLGGFINQFGLWRWVFYMLLCWAGALMVAIVFLVPETYHPVLLQRKAAHLRKTTGDSRWTSPMDQRTRSMRSTLLRACTRPLQLLALEPMCLNLCSFSAILLGILYLFFGAIPLVFETTYGFEQYQTGLAFLGLLVGMLIGVSTDPLWQRNYRRLVRKNGVATANEGEPEWRLPPAIAGAPMVTAGLFIFAWTLYRHVHWIGPIIGSGVYGFGMVLVFSGIFTFLVDAYPLYAASALSANSFLRSSSAAAFPLFGIQMYNRLNFHWASSLLAFITLAMLPFPYIFFRYGRRIRARSRFASAAG